jgi:hypothetical protein
MSFATRPTMRRVDRADRATTRFGDLHLHLVELTPIPEVSDTAFLFGTCLALRHVRRLKLLAQPWKRRPAGRLCLHVIRQRRMCVYAAGSKSANPEFCKRRTKAALMAMYLRGRTPYNLRDDYTRRCRARGGSRPV